MKNPRVSLLDRDQITSRVFDEENDAHRVVIVGSDGQALVDGLKQSVSEAMKDLKIEAPPVQMVASQVQVVEVPVIVKETEIKEIEKPIYVEKAQIVTVERPIITTRTEVVQVEKPVVMTEYKVIHVEKQVLNEKLLKGLLVLQACAMVLIALALMK